MSFDLSTKSSQTQGKKAMKPALGFVLATHSNPAQVLFLCQQLTERFAGAPIAIHHDFGKCPLDRSLFPDNVSFVEDYCATRWGGWGVVQGVLAALQLLYRKADPDWFVLLSGADYPIKSARYILRDLETNGYDAYLDYRQIQRCDLPLPTNGWGVENFVAPAWVRLAFERYMAIGFGFYKLATKLGWRRKAIYLKSSFFIRHFTPFSGSVRCFAGDFWLTGNRKAATALLADTPLNRRLMEHFRRRPNPDEAYFHTVLGNDGELKICPDNKRFTDWEGMVNHPRELGETDFPTLVRSPDHFARKMKFDPESLRRLDRLIDDSELTSDPEPVSPPPV